MHVTPLNVQSIKYFTLSRGHRAQLSAGRQPESTDFCGSQTKLLRWLNQHYFLTKRIATTRESYLKPNKLSSAHPHGLNWHLARERDTCGCGEFNWNNRETAYFKRALESWSGGDKGTWMLNTEVYGYQWDIILELNFKISIVSPTSACHDKQDT